MSENLATLFLFVIMSGLAFIIGYALAVVKYRLEDTKTWKEISEDWRRLALDWHKQYDKLSENSASQDRLISDLAAKANYWRNLHNDVLARYESKEPTSEVASEQDQPEE